MTSEQVMAPWLAVGGAEGDFITEAEFRNNPATYCTVEFDGSIAWAGEETYMVMVDRVVLPTPQFTDTRHKGVVLDYEVGDSRTVDETRTFIQNVAADIHASGRELFFYSNPLTAPTQPHHAVDETNLPDILAACDLVSLMLWSEAPEGNIPDSWDAQLARLGGVTGADWAKIVITFELGGGVNAPGTTMADADWVHAKLHEPGDEHPNKVMFWRNFAVAGSPESNEKIWRVCFGSG